MADYTPTILSGSTANYTALYTALTDELPIKHGSDANVTSRTKANATYATLHSKTIALLSDEVIKITFQANISGSAANEVAQLKWFIDSTSLAPQFQWEAASADTGADRGYVHMANITASKSGNIDFVVQWRRFSGSGTLYCDSSLLHWEIKKQRS